MNVYFHTFGCRTNQYDTERVRQAFADQGATVVASAAEADLAVVNSCTVTHESEAKLRRLVRHLARSGQETIVIGCAAARDGGTLATLPRVRAVVGGADPLRVLRAAGYRQPRVAPSLRRFDSNARAWLKIQDGCDEHCTFCATTLARGVNRSRQVAEIVGEAQLLADHHTELVLTGVHIGTYGRDKVEGGGMGGGVTLGRLLEALVTAVPSVRFRLSSIEATEVDDRIARLLIEAPRQLAAHLHAPLQSASDRILRRMGRHWYTAGTYRARIEWLTERLPGEAFGLGADVISGFPGETDAEHRATLDFVAALPFTYLHVFPYSGRPGVAAMRFSEVVLPAAIRTRAAELRSLGAAKAAAYRERRRGQVADGIVTGHQGGRIEVLTEDYLSVYLSADRWDGMSRFPVTID